MGVKHVFISKKRLALIAKVEINTYYYVDV
jgi:hypothetical protein